MRHFHKIARNPVAVALFLSLALAGCAKKNQGLDGSGVGGSYGNATAKPGTAQDFTVNVGDRIFFDVDSSTIRPDAQDILRRQAQWLMRYASYAVTIEGHADERGTREYNLALGQRRAVATRNFLVAQGVPANRLRTVTKGKEFPVAVCDDISCWSQNRRAVTVVGN